MNLTYEVEGLPAVPDFHGGDANFTSTTYLPISTPVQQTLAALIIDGIFDKFPRLQILSDKPSAIARRQLRVTSYPHENSGWIIENSY